MDFLCLYCRISHTISSVCFYKKKIMENILQTNHNLYKIFYYCEMNTDDTLLYKQLLFQQQYSIILQLFEHNLFRYDLKHYLAGN